ncbi:SAM-dependent methyltransferase [Friedmanniella endophytica]|uniref:SAM-dependent methyltransferase n=1 Tax=Microlunatus kandeliicorticis TaxID=1759536 RepID=A0A7W3ITR9_9ACTN|nr:class I SAM-dependent methyltransferase [Microlunatus kandeliicorticis]MBA8795127.1 SAM-dependent methyltransferase [Microlunatus kandeliicorticis]
MTDSALHDYYDRGLERDRLSGATGSLELARTQEILSRALPPVPATVADIGGGPGRYAFWLAGLGYRVEHRDLMELHVAQVRERGHAHVTSAIGDARDLDLGDGVVDAVLLLGPLYHLADRADRVQALAEAARVVRPGGIVFAAAISRWAPRLAGLLVERLAEQVPSAVGVVEEAERSGHLGPVTDRGFNAYVHRPAALAEEIAAAGLVLDDLVGVEGIPLPPEDILRRRADPEAWKVLLDSARVVERVPELLGLSPHLVATAHRADGAEERG